MGKNAVTTTEVEQALACMRSAFQASMAVSVDWPVHTFLARLFRAGQLSDLHVWAWEQILQDYDAMCGSPSASGGALVREVVDTSHNPFKLPAPYRRHGEASAARGRLDHLGNDLTREEMALLIDLLLDFRDRLDARYLQWAGMYLSAFRDKASIRGVTVGKVTSLLNRVARHYGRDGN